MSKLLILSVAMALMTSQVQAQDVNRPPGPAGSGERLERAFKAADRNGDGKIDWDEFRDAVPAVIQRMRQTGVLQSDDKGPLPSPGALQAGARPQDTPPCPDAQKKGPDSLEKQVNAIVDRRLDEFTRNQLPKLIGARLREIVAQHRPELQRRFQQFRENRLPEMIQQALRNQPPCEPGPEGMMAGPEGMMGPPTQAYPGGRDRLRERRHAGFNQPIPWGLWWQPPWKMKNERPNRNPSEAWPNDNFSWRRSDRRSWNQSDRPNRGNFDRDSGPPFACPNGPSVDRPGRDFDDRQSPKFKKDKDDWDQGPKQKERSSFGMLDRDHDGQIEPQEIKHAAKLLKKAFAREGNRPISTDEWDKILKQLGKELRNDSSDKPRPQEDFKPAPPRPGEQPR